VARPAALVAASGLDGLFAARVRFGVGAALGELRGTVVFDIAVGGTWTLHIDEGRVGLRRGPVRRPSATIRTDPQTMAAILDGETSGAQAFLDGRLTTRGDIALALQVDGAFDVGERPASYPRARTVRLNGVRTGYLEAGPRDAPPVLLLHGLGATNASMLPLLPALADAYRVIVPDTPGFGSSDAPRWRYTMRELAGWLTEFSAAIGATRPALVGNSLGGRIAIEAGLTAPDALDRLVLLCPSPAFRRLRQLVPAVRLINPDIGWLPIWLSHRLVVEFTRMMFSRPDRLPREWYDAAADEFRHVMSRPAHRRAFVACLRQIYIEQAYGGDGFWDRLTALDVPALFVWGERDRLVPAGFARFVSAAVPAARSVVLPDCGHVPQYEFPDETGALVREFLDASDGAVRGAGRRRSARRVGASRAG